MKYFLKFLNMFFFIIFLFAIAFNADIKAQENGAASYSRDSIISAAKEIIGSVKYCALITVDSACRANIRTMNPFPPEDDMSIWMATNSRSRKINEIKRNPNVTLYYANHSRADGYVTIKGKAILVDDMAEKLKRKRDYWAQSFPDWKYLVLIKVVPERLEVINYKKKFYNSGDTWSIPSLDF